MGKQVGLVFLHIEQVEMLHIPESAGVKDDHQGDQLATAHPGLSLGLIAQGMFLNGLFKFNAEFIDKVENFSNFSRR